MPKKSGQTALILVIVTMVTVLGIGVASSTQSNVNLKNTVYSTQSEQGLGCAEAGAERAIGLIVNDDPEGDGLDIDQLNAINILSSGSLVSCTYDFDVSEYPPFGSDLVIPKLVENTVQELRFDSASNVSLDFAVEQLTSNLNSALAVYIYRDNASQPLERRFYSIDGSVPTGFTDVNATFTVDIPSDTNYIRLRPLYSDLSITISNYPNTTGYQIISTGTAGVVRRQVNVYKFHSQLPAVFDEAVVMLGN